MFDESASDSRERAEQGRKNAAFREFYESVKLDIQNESDLGNNKTSYTISQSTREFVDDVTDRLTVEGYQVEFKEIPRPVLRISWAAEA